jgi:hypothetical protein
MLRAVLPALVLGTSIVPMTLDGRVRAADRVVVAQVMNVRTELMNGDQRRRQVRCLGGAPPRRRDLRSR